MDFYIALGLVVGFFSLLIFGLMWQEAKAKRRKLQHQRRVQPWAW